MPLDIKQQIIEQAKNAQNILICFKDIARGFGYPAGGDAVASALALQKILQKNGKNVDIASPQFVLPKALASLTGAESIKNKIQSARQAKIRVNIKESGVKNFSYDVEGEFLNIYFSPQENFINLKNLKIESGAWAYDLIFALDTSELALLGEIYEKNKPLFDSVPVVNIDDSAENEYYGEINLVDIKSSSVAEIIWDLIAGSPNLDQNIIDCVLSGIIAKTKNFRRPNISPKTLEVAGKLLTLGARRGEIIDSFYRTKSVEILRLWGRALARLKQDGNVIWSLLTRADFIHSGAGEDDLQDVIHELISNSPNTKTVALIFESPSTCSGQIIKAIIFSQNRIAHKVLACPDLLFAEKELLKELTKG